jgi:flagellar biosynthesis/type III secretory pathway protein FliH
MAILKAVAGGRLDGAVLAAREEAAREQDEAARASRAIVAAAHEEAEAIRSAARERGREEGQAAAASTLAQAAAARDRLLAAVEGEVVALALDIARRVVGELATREPAIAVESARRALAAARGRPGVLLRVHPDDAAAVRAARSALDRGIATGVALVEDPEVGRGGTVVETADGTVADARLELQLAALGRALAEGA